MLTLLSVFLLMQFIQPAKNKSQDQEPATDITGIYAVPYEVQTILKNACYDCHSNNTRYPWYADIQPISWLMAAHIKNGRKELNFNEYGNYSSKRQRNKLKRMKEQLEENKMPLSSYTLIHREARLTAHQRERVAKWIDSTLNVIETGAAN